MHNVNFSVNLLASLCDIEGAFGHTDCTCAATLTYTVYNGY